VIGRRVVSLGEIASSSVPAALPDEHSCQKFFRAVDLGVRQIKGVGHPGLFWAFVDRGWCDAVAGIAFEPGQLLLDVFCRAKKLSCVVGARLRY